VGALTGDDACDYRDAVALRTEKCNILLCHHIHTRSGRDDKHVTTTKARDMQQLGAKEHKMLNILEGSVATLLRPRPAEGLGEACTGPGTRSLGVPRSVQ